MQIYHTFDKNTLARVVAQGFSLCFVTTYAMYCFEADGNIFLPTISQTFDFRPGNFLSRWAIGVGCVGLYNVEIMTYFGHKFSHWLLFMIKSAVFCLSIVGAVCSDATNPECKGNPMIHYTAAVTFFVLYDVYMLLYVTRIRKTVAFQWLALIGVAVSLLTKLRFFEQLWNDTSFPYLAVFEWTNVGIIIAFTYLKVLDIDVDLKLCFVENKDNLDEFENGDVILWKMTGENTLAIALRYAFGTLSMCLLTAYIFDNIDETEIPMISDTFVNPPGNYISRWAGIIGTTYLQLANVVFYHSYKDKLYRSVANFAFYVSAIATFGLSVVVVVSEKEDAPLHFTSANFFFAGYDLLIGFMILARLFAEKQTAQGSLEAPLLTDRDEKKRPRSCWSVIAILVFILKVLSKFRLLWKLERSVIAVLEWTDANCILAFLVILPFLFPHEVEKFQYVIVRKKSGSKTQTLVGNDPAAISHM